MITDIKLGENEMKMPSIVEPKVFSQASSEYYTWGLRETRDSLEVLQRKCSI